jgi:hypothetical protein
MSYARRTDPQTSHDAAASVINIKPIQKIILQLLHFPKTDEELVKAYSELVEKGAAPWSSPSGLRTRRHELTDMGYVQDSDLRVKTYSGRSAIVWRLTEEGYSA